MCGVCMICIVNDVRACVCVQDVCGSSFFRFFFFLQGLYWVWSLYNIKFVWVNGCEEHALSVFFSLSDTKFVYTICVFFQIIPLSPLLVFALLHISGS